MYKPQSLTTLSRKCINVHTKRKHNIHDYELPRNLINECLEHYVADNMETNNYIIDPYLLRICETYDFSQIHISVSTDVFLTFMHWPNAVPHFAYEWNIITIKYYQIDYALHESKRACPSCAPALRLVTNTVWTAFECHGGELIEEVIQEPRYWCEYCYTTTLFKIREGHSAKRMKFSVCYEGDIDSDDSE